MKKILAFALAIIIISLSSCITSLQPLVSYDSITKDDRVIGNWAHESDAFKIEPLPQSEFAKQIEKIALNQKGQSQLLTGNERRDSIFYSKMYMVSFERQGASYNMAAAIIKLNGNMFMELYPVAMNDTKMKEDLSNPYSLNYDYLPGFTMAKVEMGVNQQLVLKFVDGSFVKQQILSGNMKLKHEANELFDTFIITASTNELRQFVTKYANDERVFSKDASFSLTRKPVHL